MDTDTTPTPTAEPYRQAEYADDVDSLLAQVRTASAALKRIETALVPLLVHGVQPGRHVSLVDLEVRPVAGEHTHQAWAHHYEIQHVDKLLSAAEHLHRDAHLIQDRYDAMVAAEAVR